MQESVAAQHRESQVPSGPLGCSEAGRAGASRHGQGTAAAAGAAVRRAAEAVSPQRLCSAPSFGFQSEPALPVLLLAPMGCSIRLPCASLRAALDASCSMLLSEVLLAPSDRMRGLLHEMVSMMSI